MNEIKEDELYQSETLEGFLGFLQRKELTLFIPNENERNSYLKAVDGAVCHKLQKGATCRNAYRATYKNGYIIENSWSLNKVERCLSTR